MRTEGELLPPMMGTNTEPFPMSGRGAIEVLDDKLVIEGSEGLPWEVQLFGFLGLVLGCVLAYLGFFYAHQRRSVVVWILGGIAAGSSLGYMLSRRRERARHKVEILPAKIVDASAHKGEVRITVQIRRRWQNRKQIVHFYPAEEAHCTALVQGIQALRVSNRGGRSLVHSA